MSDLLPIHRARARRAATLLAALAFGAAFAGGAAAQAIAPPVALPQTLTVTAEGSVSAAPDLATVSVGVSAAAVTPGAALDQMSAQLQTVIATLQGLGIAAGDIQTDQLLLEQQYNYDGPQPVATGYLASSAVTVTVRDIARIGAVLDEVVQAGANRLNGISFGFAAPADLLDEARRAAVAEAARRAGVYAGAAGVTLGGLLALSEGQSYGGPVVAVEQAMRDVPVAPGSVILSATVTLTYSIANP